MDIINTKQLKSMYLREFSRLGKRVTPRLLSFLSFFFFFKMIWGLVPFTEKEKIVKKKIGKRKKGTNAGIVLLGH